MAKLSKAESLALVRLIVRGQNKLKGTAIDLARAAFPETKTDRNFKEMSALMKQTESALRANILEALVSADIIEALDPQTVANLK